MAATVTAAGDGGDGAGELSGVASTVQFYKPRSA